ncbi:MAG: carbohydrate kinase family protein, partial [Clostridia bacterium]|nr:carbohydrate kinase family protein [Clostridia bacterium]
GNEALAEAERHGIRTDYMVKNSKKTGACIVTLDGEGVPSFDVLRDTAYDNIELDSGTIDGLAGLDADVFYFNTLCQRGSISRKTLRILLERVSFPNTVCDINIRKECYDQDSLSLCMERSSMVKISDEEGHVLYDLGLIGSRSGDFLRDVAGAYPNIRYIAYTLGSRGSRVLDASTGQICDSGKPGKVEVVSTVGAGDCYCASLTYCLYGRKNDLADSVSFATERCLSVVSKREAVPF